MTRATSRVPTRRARVRRGAVVVAAVSGLLVSGCGLGPDAPRPGTAARVGDVSISLDQVDDAVDLRCEIISEGGGAPQSGAEVRDQTLQSQTLRTIADELGDDYGVQSGAYYDQQLAGVRSDLATLGDEQLVEDALPTLLGPSYFIDILSQIGQQDLGITAADDTDNAGFSRGLDLTRQWLKSHPIETNPLFSSIEVGGLDEGVLSSRTDLAVAASDQAKAVEQALDPAAAGTDDPNADPAGDYAAALPASQRCG